ncbi:MAG: UDP-N-acetylmuramoyl-tripeptide--D-alanyl-D-alanine ligase [Paracoccus sp. (in: a-proteobacteria)]
MRPALYSLDQLAELVGGQIRPCAEAPSAILSVSHAADRTRPGAACFTVDAYRRQAVREAAKAVRKGASCIVTSTPAVQVDVPVILVGDPTVAHQTVACASRAAYAGKVIAITGSVGKTSTKDMMAAVLGDAGKTQATRLNQNPLPSLTSLLASLRSDTQFLVAEVSMTQQGMIRRKAHLVQPDIAVITAIDYSHSGNHDAEPEWVLDEKLSILDGLTSEGVAVVSSQGPHAGAIRDAALKAASRVISCGDLDTDDLRMIALDDMPGGSLVTIRFEGKVHKYLVGQAGRHLARNSLLCAAAAIAAGADPAHLGALSRYQPTPSRMQRMQVTLPGGTAFELVDDSYNSAPASVTALLDYVATRTDATRRILILGDMLELGPLSPQLHEGLVAPIRAVGADMLIAVGEQMRPVFDACGLPGFWAGTASEAAAALDGLARSGDLIAVKASNSVGLSAAVSALRKQGVGTRPARPDWSLSDS